MWRILRRLTLLILGSLLVIIGGFVAMVSFSGGFGASSIGLRIVRVAIGVLLFVAGLYLYYLGNNKRILKVLGDLIDALLTGIS